MVYNFPDESSFIVSTMQGKTFSNKKESMMENFIKLLTAFLVLQHFCDFYSSSDDTSDGYHLVLK